MFYYRVNKVHKVTEFHNKFLSSVIALNAEIELLRIQILDLVKEKLSPVTVKRLGTNAKEVQTNIDIKCRFLVNKANQRLKNQESEVDSLYKRLTTDLCKNEIEMKNIGKFLFKDYSNYSALGNICQKLLDEFSCCFLKRKLNVCEVELLNVTRVMPLECPSFKIEQETFRYFLLVLPISITNINNSVYTFVDQLINESLKESTILLTATDCLVAADAKLENWTTTSELDCEPKLALIVATKTSNVILSSVPVPGHNVYNTQKLSDEKTEFKICSKIILQACDAVPAFILEFRYKHESKQRRSKTENKIQHNCNLDTEPINNLRDVQKNAAVLVTCADGANLSLEMINGSQQQLEYQLDGAIFEYMVDSIRNWRKLTSLDISHSSITKFGQLPKLLNVIELNVSHNRIETLDEVLLTFPNAIIINASFNNLIQISLENNQHESSELDTTQSLTTLDISWNKIINLMNALMFLKVNAPNISTLDVRFNPIVDMHSLEHSKWMAKKYLPRLNVFNEHSVDSSESALSLEESIDALPRAVVDVCCKNLVASYCESRMCLNATNKLSIGWNAHAGFDKDERLICLSATSALSQITSSGNIGKPQYTSHLQYLNLSSCQVDSVACLVHLENLVQLNLSNNLLRFSNTFITNMPKLVDLNISYNYLSTLNDLTSVEMPTVKILTICANRIATLNGVEKFPGLEELYASHNFLYNLQSIKVVKELQMLRAISLKYNMINYYVPYKNFLLFNQHLLEVLIA